MTAHEPQSDPPVIKFSTLNDPVVASVEFYRARLSHARAFLRQNESPFWDLVDRLLRGAWTSYKAACLLMSDDRETKFPVQAAILARNTQEALANLFCLLEQPDRWRLFAIDHYKHHRSALQHVRKSKRLMMDRMWSAWAETEATRLVTQAHTLKLTDAEASHPGTLPSWPKPRDIVDSKKGDPDPTDTARLRPYLTGGRKTVLCELRRTWYGWQSRYAHHLGDAVAETSPSDDRMEYLRAHAVLPAALCLASMCAEIEAHGGKGWPQPMPTSLTTLWELLRRMGDSGDQLYRHRYRRLLAALR